MNAADIKRLCLQQGAHVVGIADADAFTGAHPGHAPKDRLTGCRSVIVVGSAFIPDSLSMNTVEYTRVRNDTHQIVSDYTSLTAAIMKDQGMKVKVLSGLGGKWLDGRFRGPISLKHAAELAGIGRMGRNGLVINEKYGNLLWFSAILTTTQLDPDGMQKSEPCRGCNLCIACCPSGALDSERFGHKECYRTCYKTVKGQLELKCFECRKVCPVALTGR